MPAARFASTVARIVERTATLRGAKTAIASAANDARQRGVQESRIRTIVDLALARLRGRFTPAELPHKPHRRTNRVQRQREAGQESAKGNGGRDKDRTCDPYDVNERRSRRAA